MSLKKLNKEKDSTPPKGNGDCAEMVKRMANTQPVSNKKLVKRKEKVLPSEMVDNSTSPCDGISGWMFIIGQSGQVTSSHGEASSECFCWPLYRLPRDITLLPHQACVALKRKLAARGRRAPPAPSIVDGFCQLPWLECVAGSVAPPSCHLVREAAGVLSAARREDEQNDRKLATTPDGPADVETA
jgi:hypothetical protein